jgi:hypothetical protein
MDAALPIISRRALSFSGRPFFLFHRPAFFFRHSREGGGPWRHRRDAATFREPLHVGRRFLHRSTAWTPAFALVDAHISRIHPKPFRIFRGSRAEVSKKNRKQGSFDCSESDAKMCASNSAFAGVTDVEAAMAVRP